MKQVLDVFLTETKFRCLSYARVLVWDLDMIALRWSKVSIPGWLIIIIISNFNQKLETCQSLSVCMTRRMMKLQGATNGNYWYTQASPRATPLPSLSAVTRSARPYFFVRKCVKQNSCLNMRNQLAWASHRGRQWK